MRLQSRLKKLDAAMPRCVPGILRLAGPDHIPSEADRCRWCGGSHVLIIEEIIVASHADAEMVETRNGDLS